MNAQHTPGPWEARPFTGPRMEAYVWTSGRDYLQDYCIASVSGFDKVRYHEGMTTAEDTIEANARLIAAAPDLLAALTDPCMLPTLEAYAKGMNANAARCLENARAAIAKATGE